MTALAAFQVTTIDTQQFDGAKLTPDALQTLTGNRNAIHAPF